MAKLDSINYKGTLQEIVPEIAPLFKTTEAYSAGDHVIHDAQWYTFKEDKAAGAWDDTKVDGPFTVSDKITSLKEDLGIVEFAIGGEKKKPNIARGVLTWSNVNQRMGWDSNNARASADLRFLGLEQGDTVGITDYTTYSIAFGDNASGWYGGGYQTTDVTANSTNINPWIILIKRNDDANITDADLQALTDQFHATKDVTEIPIRKARNGFIHLSFDDVGYSIDHLKEQTSGYFASIWDEPFFAMLKRIHDTYGAVFSLYVWDIDNIANISSRFRKDFENASDWLKFGFHAIQEGSLENATAAEAKAGYDTFITNIFNKCGGVNSVDRIPRLNYFAGNVNALKALRDCDCGCIGFLNTYDTRNAYYLTDEELTYLRTHSLWSDRANGLQFVSTVMCLDWFVSGFSSNYEYNTPVKDNPYDELVYRYGQPSMADLYSNLIVFTHEWQTYSSAYVLNTDMVNRLEQVCKFANDYGYDFDYPQNRVQNITSFAIGDLTITINNL